MSGFNQTRHVIYSLRNKDVASSFLRNYKMGLKYCLICSQKGSYSLSVPEVNISVMKLKVLLSTSIQEV